MIYNTLQSIDYQYIPRISCYYLQAPGSGTDQLVIAQNVHAIPSGSGWFRFIPALAPCGSADTCYCGNYGVDPSTCQWNES